jgi:hypothetical protein
MAPDKGKTRVALCLRGGPHQRRLSTWFRLQAKALDMGVSGVATEIRVHAGAEGIRMTGLPHLYPHPNRMDEVVLAQHWRDLVTEIAEWRHASGGERRMWRRRALADIAAWKRRSA